MPRLAVVALTLLGVLVVAGPAAAQAPAPSSFGDEPGALRLPEAVAVAPDGSVLVGDHFSGRIHRFRDGREVGAFGLHGEGCGRLGAIGGVAAGRDGRVYVLDSDQQLVHVFAADGRVQRCFGGRGRGAGKFFINSGSYAASSASGGIAVTDDAIYVADTNNDRVQKFTLTGGSPRVLGRGRLDQPQGLAVRGSRLVVADDGSHRVVELTTSGRFVRATDGVRLRFPYDVAITPSGRTYVADNNLHRIVVLDRRLRRVGGWGREGSGTGRFSFPRALALTDDGHLLVADAGNDRVAQYTAAGRWVRALGSNGRRPGLVTAPQDVAVNGRGEVAVADGNGRIAWFGLDGRRLGEWAQSRSFQQSTAVVSAPGALAFAADGVVRVQDGGTLREYAAGRVAELVGAPDDAARAGADRLLVSGVDVGASGATWVLRSRGRFNRLDAAGTLGPTFGTAAPTGRSVTAIAELGDGSVVLAEGTSPNQVRPADGSVLRYAADGRLLATWAIPRPPGGQPTRPAGLAAAPDGGAWVADAANDRILRLGADGTIVATLGTAGAGAGELAEPHGLTVDCDGGLVVADTGNNRVVRYPAVQAAAGCAAATAPATPAAGRPPGPVGLRLKTVRRAQGPATALAEVRATCRRTCTLAAQATLGVLGGRSQRSFPVTVRVSGSTIRLSLAARTVAELRTALRGASIAGFGVTVAATSADGVVDRAGLTWSLRGT